MCEEMEKMMAAQMKQMEQQLAEAKKQQQQMVAEVRAATAPARRPQALGDVQRRILGNVEGPAGRDVGAGAEEGRFYK